MGMDLTSDSGAEFRFTGTAWNFCLRLAESYGWRGAGTCPPQGVSVDDWSGTYDSNEGQHVSADDSAALADALDKALSDPGLGRAEERVASEMSRLLSQHFGKPIPIEPPDAATAYQEFAAFCRSGGFRID